MITINNNVPLNPNDYTKVILTETEGERAEFDKEFTKLVGIDVSTFQQVTTMITQLKELNLPEEQCEWWWFGSGYMLELNGSTKLYSLKELS